MNWLQRFSQAVSSFFRPVTNVVKRDVVQPIQRTVVQPAQRNVQRNIQQAQQALHPRINFSDVANALQKYTPHNLEQLTSQAQRATRFINPITQTSAITHAIFPKLPDPLGAISKFAADQTGGAVQSFVKAPFRIAAQVTGHDYKPQNKFLLGNEPIKSASNYAKQTANDLGAAVGKPQIGNKLGWAALPAGILLTAGDLSPLSSEDKQVAKGAINLLSKTNDIKSITSIISKDKTLSRLPNNIKTLLASRVTNISDPKRISGEVNNAVSAAKKIANSVPKVKTVKINGKDVKIFAPKYDAQAIANNTPRLNAGSVAQDVGKNKPITLYHGTSNSGANALSKKVAIATPEQKLKFPSTGGGFIGLSTTTDRNVANNYASALSGKTVEIKLKPEAKILNVDTGGNGIDNHFTNEQLTRLSKKYDAIRDVGSGAESEVRILRENNIIQPGSNPIAQNFNPSQPRKTTGQWSKQQGVIKGKINNPLGAEYGDHLRINNPLDAKIGPEINNPLGAKVKGEPTINNPLGADYKKSGPIYDTYKGPLTGQKERGFTTTVKESPNTSPKVASLVKEKYSVKPNRVLVKEARSVIKNAPDEAYKIATTEGSDRGVAVAGELIKYHQSRGEYQLAAEIADKAAVNLTELGRGVQAASLYNRLSPEGIVRYAAREAQKGSKTLSADVTKQLTEMAKEVAKMPDGEEKAIATHKLLELARSQNKSKVSKQLVGVWKAGLLTSPTTSAGNILSNTIESATKNTLIDPLAAGLDKVVSLFTGKRTKALTFRGLGTGTKEGVQKGKTYLKTGYDVRNPLSKYDLQNKTYFSDNALGNAAHKYTEGVFRFLGAQDQPFYYANMRNSLYDQAIVAAKNEKLRGKDAKQLIDAFLKNPPEDAIKIAAEDAARSVFGNKTGLGKLASGLHNSALGDVVAPFTGVPSSIATRIVERSPIGAVKEIASQISHKSFDQRKLVEALSNSAVGTGGAIALGGVLVDSGRITLAYPTDKKERRLWELEGKQPYSIRLGDHWYSLNYVQPFGSLLAAGATYKQALKNGSGQADAAGAALAGAGKSVVGQSFLQGVSGALNAINDPVQSAGQQVKSLAGSIIPNIIKRTSTAIDPLQRQINTPLDAIKAALPGARQTLTPKTDAFGKPLANPMSPVDTLFNPLRPYKIPEKTALNSELRRLQDSGNGVIVNPSPKQSDPVVGQKTQQVWGKLVQDPGYSKLSDVEKQKVLANSLEDIKALNQYATDPSVKLTKRQQAQLSGADLLATDYLPKKSTPKTKKPKVRISRGRKGGSRKVARAPKVRFTSVRAPKLKQFKAATSKKRNYKVAVKGRAPKRAKVKLV